MRAAARALLGSLVLAAPPAARDAAAHGEGGADVRPVLDPLPAELAGMRVELHHTIAPQVVLANPTSRIVEVLDPDGVAFLRIGPAGVEANVATRAWYETYSPGAPVPAGAGRRDARWLRVRQAPSFGWFDPRLDASAGAVPGRVVDAGRHAVADRFRIALRVDGQPAELRGRFVVPPPAQGRWVARLTSPSGIAPGVRVTLLPGASPGLLVRNTSGQVLTVLGHDGEPFLRIGPQGVEADVRSTAWRRSGRAAAVTAASASPQLAADWQRVATVPRFGWVDERTAAASSMPAPDDPARRHELRVPMLLGGERLEVAGEIVWQAFAAAPDRHERRHESRISNGGLRQRRIHAGCDGAPPAPRRARLYRELVSKYGLTTVMYRSPR